MSLDIQFAYVCRRKFAELTGDSDLRRFCDTCELEVINLDPLDDEARSRVFQEAEKNRTVPCISVTMPLLGTQECSGPFNSDPEPAPLTRPTLGVPQYVP